jgi:hypothetical protein
MGYFRARALDVNHSTFFAISLSTSGGATMILKTFIRVRDLILARMLTCMVSG